MMKYRIFFRTAVLWIIICLTIQSFSVVTAQNEEAVDKKAYTILSKMGIVDFSEQDTEQYVSRYDFLLYAMRTAGYSDEMFVSDGQYIFADVEEGSEYLPLIETAYSAGVIKGNGNGLFYGDSNVTSEQAVTMVLRAIDYDIIAANGNSYMNIATNLDLFEGLNIDSQGNLTRAQAVILLYNVMEANTLEVASDGTVTQSENTVFGDIHSVGYKEGIVQKDFFGDIYGESSHKTNSITINDEQYELYDGDDYSSLLGQRVRVYYRDEKDFSGVLYIEPKKNNVVQIKRNELIKYIPGEIQYYSGDEPEKAEISDSAVTLLNGERVTVTSEYTVPVAADIRLVDNNNDFEYDYVFIDQYSTVHVKQTDSENKKLFNSITKIGNIDLGEYSRVLYTYSDGQKAVFEDIAVNDVLNIYSYKSNGLAVVKIHREVIGFEVKSINENSEGGFKFYYLYDEEGNEYKTNLQFSDVISTKIKTGYFYNFALDSNGDIAAVNEYNYTGEYIYAYVCNYYINEHNSDELIIELYTENDEFISCIVSKKVHCVNNSLSLSISELKDKLSNSGLIRCTVNDGVLKRIEFPSDDLSYDGMKIIGASSITSSTNGENRYYGSTYNMGGQFTMKSNTKVMIVPSDANRTDKSVYSVTTASYFKSDAYYPGVVGYGSDKKGFVSDVVLVKDPQGILYNSVPMLVTKISQEYDPATDGIRTAITGYEGGKLKKYLLADNTKAEYTLKTTGETVPIEVGDAIRINFDVQNDINFIKLMFDESEKEIYGVNDKNDDEITYGNGGFHTWGTLYSKDDTCFRVIRNGSSTVSPDIYSTNTSTHIYEYDSNAKDSLKVREISLWELSAYEDSQSEADNVFIYMYKPPCELIVSYK